MCRESRDNTELIKKLKEKQDLTAETITKEYLRNNALYNFKMLDEDLKDNYIPLLKKDGTFHDLKTLYNDPNSSDKTTVNRRLTTFKKVKKARDNDEKTENDNEEDNEYNTKKGDVAKQIILSESPTTPEDTEPSSISEPNKRDADYPVSTYEYTKELHGPQPALYNKFFSYNEHDDSDDKNKKQFFDNLTNELGFTEEELVYNDEKGNKQYEVRLDQILDKINDSGKYDKISILDESCNPLDGRIHISDNATSGGKTKKRTKSSAILTKKRKKMKNK